MTLAGEATSGGSGRAAGHRLTKSGVRLQLSTMALFRPDGTLFEGNRVVPDVELHAEPGDLVGAPDAVLQRALELLRGGGTLARRGLWMAREDRRANPRPRAFVR